MSTSGSKSNEHVAHFLVDIHIKSASKSKTKIPKTLKFQCFRDLLLYISLFKLANKSLLLYIFVWVLWFYLVLYVFHCPKPIDCTERCYQFVIMFLLSVLSITNIPQFHWQCFYNFLKCFQIISWLLPYICF